MTSRHCRHRRRGWRMCDRISHLAVNASSGLSGLEIRYDPRDIATTQMVGVG